MPDSLTANQVDLVVGSFSGAIGERVACEGWVRTEPEKRTVFGVLFPDRDEFVTFLRMSPAQDGAHHYVEQQMSIPFSQVTAISMVEVQNTFDVRHRSQDGRRLRFKFTVSSRDKQRWLNAVQQHVKYRYGMELEIISPPGSLGQQALPSPVPPSEQSEQLSSIKLRRVLSGPPTSSAIGRRGTQSQRSSKASYAEPVTVPVPVPLLVPSHFQGERANGAWRHNRAEEPSEVLPERNPLRLPTLPRRSSLSNLVDVAQAPQRGTGAPRASAWTDASETTEYEVV